MSVLNQSGEEQVECPLCMEPLEVDDLHFYPCTCGYQICRFCWNRIREGENGLCPACRKAYPENPADFTPLSQEQVAAIKTEKKAREQKRRNKTLESRRALANVRVVQNNLVFVVGLPVRLADPEILKRQEYFGKYGKIHKVVINQSTAYAGSQGPSASAYVTYVSPADALRAIQGVNNVTLDGRVLKGSLGTTKYCANFMKNQPCPKPDCMYLHELGDPKASFTKEEMHAGLHQVYERKLHNQLLQSAKDDKHYNSSGNSSTNAEKGSSKDGNQSNFIPTTVVTSSHINVVNSSKSNKKDPANVSNSNSNGSGSGSSSGASSSNGKEAWPSLGSSPPSDSPARKQSSPKPQHSTVKSQENGTSESSSPTLVQQQSQTKSKEHTDTKTRNKDSNGTNGQIKKSRKHKSTPIEDDEKLYNSQPTQSVFENEPQNFLTNELDELESDRHSLLENHDLLDNSDHSLLEDDNTHNLLNDANNEVMMMQRHREMLAGLVETNHILPHMKTPLVNGYGLLDRDMSYIGNDRQISQMSQGLMEQKELALRARRERRPFLPCASLGHDNTNQLLGANYHQNPSMVPPFGMRAESSLGGFLLQPPLLQPAHNGFDASHQAVNSEGRYLAENMDKFFTDFRQAQQLRALRGAGAAGAGAGPGGAGGEEARRAPATMLSAERLEMEHKQRMNNLRSTEGNGGRAAGDGDDDLDFDPFKETQKALAEMMESEMMQNTVSSGDNMERVRRSRLPPPGFGHAGAFGLPRHTTHNTHNQGYNTNSGFSDWTQMDPAIVSTSVNFGKSAAPPQLSQQQQELFARFNQLGVTPNGVGKLQVPLVHGWAQQQQKLWPSGAMGGGHAYPGAGLGLGGLGLGLGGLGVASIPLPPGFAPAKPPQHPAECIDAK